MVWIGCVAASATRLASGCPAVSGCRGVRGCRSRPKNGRGSHRGTVYPGNIPGAPHDNKVHGIYARIGDADSALSIRAGTRRERRTKSR